MDLVVRFLGAYDWHIHVLDSLAQYEHKLEPKTYST